MTVLSGLNGSVDGIAAIGKWSVNPKIDTPEYATSATQGAKDRVKGNDDWDGEYNAVGPIPAVMPGDFFNFGGTVDGAQGVFGPAYMEEFSLKLDVEGATPIQHACKFSGNGALQKGPVAFVDETLSNARSAISLPAFFKLPNDMGWTEILDVRSMDLTLRCEGKPYRSSTTVGHTKRVMGNVDASFSVQFYQGNLASLIPEGTIIGIRLYVNATEFWEIAWGIVQGYSGIEVDRNTVNVVGATMNCGFKSFVTDDNGDGVQGWIVPPGAEGQWWGEFAV
jgi:hypothetical protein